MSVFLLADIVVLWLYNYISISLFSSVWQKPGSWRREQDISVNCWLETRLESPKTNSWIAGPVNVKPLLGFFVHFSLSQKLPSMCLVFYQDEAQVVPILKWVHNMLGWHGKKASQSKCVHSQSKRGQISADGKLTRETQSAAASGEIWLLPKVIQLFFFWNPAWGWKSYFEPKKRCCPS